LVFTSKSVYLLIVQDAPKEFLKEIDQTLSGSEKILIGEKCKLNWLRSARQKKIEGIGNPKFAKIFAQPQANVAMAGMKSLFTTRLRFMVYGLYCLFN
jgi:hypothetical protein